MTNDSTNFFSKERRSNWVRLRTMILIRWVAIGGQISAIIIAITFYQLSLNLRLCLIAILVSGAVNLAATKMFPKSKRLSEFENSMMFFFDVLQLSFLLYLTGGLQNPFSILLLAPIAVSASVLNPISTFFLCGSAIFLATILTTNHIPLMTIENIVLEIPNIFVFGNWVALVVALIFLSVYTRWVTVEMNTMGDALVATQIALSREQKLTDLGGIISATAHELGTPLATIKLTSSELMEELKNNPELYEDALLIREQANRCRDILRKMGRSHQEDQELMPTPVSEIIREAAEPHLGRRVPIETRLNKLENMENEAQPFILRRPEIIYGLRNMIQNAVDFAASKILIEAYWSHNEIAFRIVDDGPGFPEKIRDYIGDPFVRNRKPEENSNSRPYYEGMGLGLFIAKTLLERTHAKLKFENGNAELFYDGDHRYKIGAIVEIVWPRNIIEYKKQTS